MKPGCGGRPRRASRALAPCPDAEARNGEEAIAWAEKLKSLAPPDSPLIWDTLAAAYAEAGRFDQAVEAATKAVSLARAAGNMELAGAIQKRLALYATSKPYHQ